MTRFGPAVPFLGLCDQTAGEESFLADLMGVDPHAVELDTAGVNHMTFTRAVRIGGADRTGDVWARLDEVTPAEVGDPGWWRVVALFRELRFVPSLYLQYFRFHDEVLAEQRAKGRTRAEEVIAMLPDVVASYRREADAAYPRPSMARASEEHGDFAVSIMAAMRDGAEHRAILNLPNTGQVADLPGGAVVETPAFVRGRTAEPIDQGGLPEGVRDLVQRVAEHARLTAEAAVTGDRAHRRRRARRPPARADAGMSRCPWWTPTSRRTRHPFRRRGAPRERRWARPGRGPRDPCGRPHHGVPGGCGHVRRRGRSAGLDAARSVAAGPAPASRCDRAQRADDGRVLLGERCRPVSPCEDLDVAAAVGAPAGGGRRRAHGGDGPAAASGAFRRGAPDPHRERAAGRRRRSRGSRPSSSTRRSSRPAGWTR